MAIYIGSNQLMRRFVGEREVLRSYVGDQLVWTKPAQYPANGTWGGGAVPYSGNPVTNPLQVDTHTISGDGNYTITWSIVYTTANLARSMLYRDGGFLSGSTSWNRPETATATWTGNCTAGQVIQFQAASAGTAGSVASGGTWTITKN